MTVIPQMPINEVEAEILGHAVKKLSFGPNSNGKHEVAV
jgi:hypothetical protein